MNPGPPPLGLYSIGVRDFQPSRHLPWARANGIPFVHLRAGARGLHISRRDDDQMSAWRDVADRTVPITAVTTDVELADLLHADATALAEVRTSALRGELLGARSVRLLATETPETWAARIGPPEVPARGRLLVELHAPGWFTPDGIDAALRLADSHPRVSLLVDTLQFSRHAQDATPDSARRLVTAAAVVHLSDDGSGLAEPGHRLVVDALREAMRRGARPELAFEWTGPDRSATACLDRYRRAVTWTEKIW
ncbi:AP endonuclease [Streptomyces sp. 4503]|uniref:AP endonuclease n=1 Tax=Streptomyces niphimycinicus TaxID=2842201 RepID=A0ABS6C6W8_9ACTN|nr:AP endonuclease [Streptomyces niphimycinicus]MBU3862646.1 AP endonuclease [Streptomyces niphimycinicus]